MRQAGILLPIFSLPSPWGVGTMGARAREFVDFLAEGGQSCWQVLPMGPTSYGDSPYQSYSSFAGNPYFIDLDELAGLGLLEPEEYQTLDWGGDPGRVDYAALYRNRFSVLRLACSRLGRGDKLALRRTVWPVDWLEDYALFMALKEKHGGVSWLEWPEDIRLRRPEALEAARTELAEEIDFWYWVQHLFFAQWWALKEYANQKGISIIGDLPIYVALDSADVWANREQFQLDGHGFPTEVAGCPPDAFTADGQLWGNPLFDWERMEQEGYAWWLKRVSFQFQLYDTLRIDHFRGFESYYAIPFGDQTARNGRWRPGPGIRFFQTVEQALGKRDIIAEDLGFLTPPVRKMLRASGYPGMKVLQFAFGSREKGSEYLPHCYPVKCVAYPGTHDNDTIQGWMRSASRKETAFARDYLRLSRREGYHWGMMRGVWSSPARLAVVPMQDLLGLGSEARMNTPSTLGGNWQWRLPAEGWGAELAEKLHREMETYQRLKKPASRVKKRTSL